MGALLVVVGAFLLFGGVAVAASVNKYGKDIGPENQGGKYSRAYDSAFLAASNATGVPFALIKAHAVRESALDPNATRNEPPRGSRPASASYGLTQILWWPGSERFDQFGYPDDSLDDGAKLFDPETNAIIGAKIMQDNLDRLGNLRDAINAYNTGVRENVRIAPGNYVNDVIKIYSELIKEGI